MKLLSAVFLVALGAAVGRGADLPRATPESQGVSPRGVLAFVDAADKSVDSLHGFVLVRHGHVVAEGWWAPYDAKTRHALYSLSKSFTSTAVGLAVADGKLSLDDELTKLFPDDLPANRSANLKAMRIRDLLRMATGHETEPPRPAEGNWAKAFLAHPVPFKPGTHFKYNTPATYMLSAAVQKATGQTTLDYLKPRLFDPLGIENPTWEADPQGVTVGGYGLSVRTEDVAKFGQLYLQRGKWNGKQLVPAAWVDEATRLQVANGSNPKSDWDQGYGYQFWRCRHGAYRGDGAFGQYCVVLPQQEAVIAITAGVKNMQAVLDLAWEHLLPAMGPDALDAFPADPDTRARLDRTLKGLTLRPQDGTGTAPKAAAKRYSFPANDRKLEWLALETAADGGTVLATRTDGVERRVACGKGAWVKGRAAWGRLPEQPAAASGAWTADDTFTAKVCFVETPFTVTVRLTFADGKVRCESEQSVGFGPGKDAPLVGVAE